MQNYHQHYYHAVYKKQKKRANLVMSPELYARFKDYATTLKLSTNQGILKLAQEHLDGQTPRSPEWEKWQETVSHNLHKVANEVHQLVLQTHLQEAPAPDILPILNALYQHLRKLEAKWNQLQPQ